MRPKNKRIIDGCVEIILEAGRPLPTRTLTERLEGRMPTTWLPANPRTTANILSKCDKEKKLRCVPENVDRPNNKKYLWTVRDEWRN
jgi:hypothetical protein|tara:strand:+ start:512 stop:772 length:261 start_codon:yes stop_codon:yes gene_type:complete